MGRDELGRGTQKCERHGKLGAMKVLWCWRCGREVPMLDEEEFQLVTSKHGPKVAGAMAERVERFYGPVVAEYERLTGYCETNPTEVYHHRLSLYGPGCPGCGKPLRTPQAKYCAACGHRFRRTINPED
jgi:hypothetical protein